MNQSHLLSIVNKANSKESLQLDTLDASLTAESILEMVTPETVSLLQTYEFNIFKFTAEHGRTH